MCEAGRCSPDRGFQAQSSRRFSAEIDRGGTECIAPYQVAEIVQHAPVSALHVLGNHGADAEGLRHTIRGSYIEK
jgi:hypothetical protein